MTVSHLVFVILILVIVGAIFPFWPWSGGQPGPNPGDPRVGGWGYWPGGIGAFIGILLILALLGYV